MYHLWNSLIEPLLVSLDPRTIIEVGCESGRNTVNLFRFAMNRDGVLHVIDPVPPRSLEEWRELGGDHFVYHPSTSLEALPLIGPAEVVLIDGDHNWYTVYHELQLIKKLAGDSAASMPPVLFHDVSWPYGRRDMYYDPDSIPEGFRNEFAKAGLKPGSSELHEGGLNDHLCNAVREGGPRNGVLTAIEDFVAENRESVDFIEIRAFNGLGVLWSRRGGPNQECFVAQIEKLVQAQLLLALLGDMESDRIFRQYSFRSSTSKLKSKNRILKSRLSGRR